MIDLKFEDEFEAADWKFNHLEESDDGAASLFRKLATELLDVGLNE